MMSETQETPKDFFKVVDIMDHQDLPPPDGYMVSTEWEARGINKPYWDLETVADLRDRVVQAEAQSLKATQERDAARKALRSLQEEIERELRDLANIVRQMR